MVRLYYNEMRVNGDAKMRLKNLFHMINSLLFTVYLLPVYAAPQYSMNAITHALQTEYQQQLQQAKPRSHIKTSKRPKRRTNYQQLLQQPTAPAYQAVTPKAKPYAADSEVLFKAAKLGDVNRIAQAVRQGININRANSAGETALHMAAAKGHYSAVIYLVSHGANPQVRTLKNWLPLHHAVRFKHANIANYLKQKGNSPYARTSDGLSAIDMARNNHDTRLLRILGAK